MKALCIYLFIGFLAGITANLFATTSYEKVVICLLCWLNFNVARLALHFTSKGWEQ